MLNPREESRTSLFNLIRMNRALADEVIYIESTMEMLEDAIESMSLSIDAAVEPYNEISEELDRLSDSIEQLALKVESLQTDFKDPSEHEVNGLPF